MTGVSPLNCCGIQHITGLDGSSLCVRMAYCSVRKLSVMSTGGVDASISSAGMGVVLKALVIRHRALLCAWPRVFLMYVDLPSQNATLLYVMIGSMAPMYSCLR